MPQQGEVSYCRGPCPTPPQLQFYQSIIFASPLIVAFLLLFLFCLLYIRRCRNTDSIPQSRLPFVSGHRQIDPGLSKSFRQKLPTISFDENFSGSSEDNQCAVCLGEYELHEKLQQLPLCKHSFHVQCIDKWLAKSTTCPMCRCSLLKVNMQPKEKQSMEMLMREERSSSRWEEMVVNEAHEGHSRVDGLVGTFRIGMASSELSQYRTDLAINIERS